jgi:hypothetical protein
MRRLIAAALANATFALALQPAQAADPANVGTDKSVAGLLAADVARYTAMSEKDTATLDRLLAKELVYVHSGGEGQTREGHFGDVAAGRGVYNKVTVLGAMGRIYGDVGVVWGVADFDEGKEPRRRMSRLGYAETWVWRDRHWQLVLFHASRVRQPEDTGPKPPKLDGEISPPPPDTTH